MSGINEKGEPESFNAFCKRSLDHHEKQRAERDRSNDELRQLTEEGELLLAEDERREP